MKKIIVIISCFLGFISCQNNENEVKSPIKIGTDENSLSEVVINKLTERKILLSGGDEKFKVNIENSKIASASISQDTLKIKGLLEGETFATIISHNMTSELKVKVIPAQMSISQDEIRLFPQDLSKVVSVSGGSDQVDLTENDPDDVIDVKWNGVTRILEILAKYEGVATITLTSSDGTQKSLKVVVRPDGTTDEVGLYTTFRRAYTRALAPRLVVKRKGVGFWLSSITNPYGESGSVQGVVLKVPFVENPIKGKKVNLPISFLPSNEFSGIKGDTYLFEIEAVTEKTIILSTQRFKIVLPKE